MRTAGSIVALTVITGAAAADPPPADPAPASTAGPPAAAPKPVVLPVILGPPTRKPVESLRFEAAREAGERVAEDWRYPEPGPLFGVEHGLWYVGYGHYRPRSARAAALHGGSIAATVVGELFMAADLPVAAVGAFLTGATLDAATSEADRAAEARR